MSAKFAQKNLLAKNVLLVWGPRRPSIENVSSTGIHTDSRPWNVHVSSYARLTDFAFGRVVLVFYYPSYREIKNKRPSSFCSRMTRF